ncbi:hypothetical protein V8C42DRAFT_312410 [Trichoderma barbatum]
MSAYFQERIASISVMVMDLIEHNNLSVLAIATTCVLTIVTCYWVLRGYTSTFNSKRGKKATWSKDPITLRISGVPPDWDRERLLNILRSKKFAEEVTVESLAHEANIESQTATVTMKNKSLYHWRGGTFRFSLNEYSSNGFDSVSVEKDFLGLTTLYRPPSKDHKVDIIALSGLGGHAFGSFKERGGTHMWLRDSLPGYLTTETDQRPMARVMIYGYESGVARSKSMQNLEDLATTFHSSLLALASGPTTRPIILIGHSLGGLIIKQALISLSSSTNPDDQKLIRAVYGVIFFGTPHDGMDVSSLIPMVGDGPNRFLIESISRINSQIISIQQREFHNALGKKGDSEVFCFYETLESPTAQRDKRGEWKMIGPSAVLVTKFSATHCRPWEDGSENICAIARTHSDMVKFGPHDPDYRNVIQRIRGLSRRAIRARDRLQTTTSKFLVPYRQNPAFVGRSEILNELKLTFGLGQQGEQAQCRRRVSLYGLSGVGKTQLALAYVYWIHETLPEISVFWVHASNADRFRAAYASIAEKCDVPGREDPKVDILSLVKKWLEEQDKMQWLIVIDNADDIELFFPLQQKSDVPSTDNKPQQGDRLARYIPDCNHGSVFFTTRNKQVGIKFGQGSPPIEVSKMTDDEAHQLVQSILRTEVSSEEMSPLASRLEHLPLALAQATSFIQENTISISDYMQLLDEGDASLVDQLSEPFETVGRDSDTPQALTATWIISFQQIERTQPIASDTLCFLSLLHNQAIPKTYTEEYYLQRQPEHAQGSLSAGLIKALGTLKAFSFISEGKDRHINMHRLVQLVTRKWLINKDQLAQFTECAIKILSASYPLGGFETLQACLKYLPHVNSVLVRDGTNSRAENIDRSILLHKLARYHSFKGEWKHEERNLLSAVKMQTQELGEENPKTLYSRKDLAKSYHHQGRLKEAEDLASQTIKIMKRVFGEDHFDTLSNMANLALTYEGLGRLNEAEDLKLQVIETKKRVLGEDNPETIDSMGSLITVYIRQGRFKEAEDLSLLLIETKKRVLGPEHPQTLSAMNNLTLIYENQGRLKEAEDLALQVIEISDRVLGEDHLSAMVSRSNLAGIYRKQRRWREAEDLGIMVMEGEKRVLGEKHYDTLATMNNLAVVYLEQGRCKEATDLMTQVIKIRKQELGVGHPDTLQSMGNLAAVYGKEQRW